MYTLKNVSKKEIYAYNTPRKNNSSNLNNKFIDHSFNTKRISQLMSYLKFKRQDHLEDEGITSELEANKKYIIQTDIDNANRSDFFKTASNKTAILCNNVRIIKSKLDPENTRKEEMWNDNDDENNNNTLTTFDCEIMSKTNDETKICVNIANSHTKQGYITHIYDGARSGIKEASMVEGTVDESLNPGSFGSVHKAGNDGKIIDLTIEGSMDNHTKLIAEGARFQCVRDNIDTLEDNSIFVFHKDEPNNNGYYAIPFSNLWQKWDAFFQKRYNLTDDDIFNKYTSLRGGNLPSAGKEFYLIKNKIKYYTDDTQLRSEKIIKRY